MPDLSLHIGAGCSDDFAMCMQWQSQVRSSKLSAAMDQKCGHKVVRTVQVRLPYDHQDQAIQKGMYHAAKWLESLGQD